MIDVPIGKIAHAYGVGSLVCVADPPTNHTCTLCALKGKQSCVYFACLSHHREDKTFVHFEKAKNITVNDILDVMKHGRYCRYFADK